MHYQTFLRVVSFLVIASTVGCSAGNSGGSEPGPPSVSFSIVSPKANAQVLENQLQPVKLVWKDNGSAISNQKITFTTTQGNLLGDASTTGTTVTASTLSDGSASVQLVAQSGGPVKVTATAVDPNSQKPLTATLSMTLVGPPSNFTATAPSPIAVSSTSLITASVTDSSSTGLQGIPITFTLANGGGKLSVSSQNTDSSGAARSTFTPDGTVPIVEVDVAEAVLGTKKVMITVGQPSDSISFSSCPTTMPSSGKITCQLSVSDPSGKPVSGQTVNLSAKLGTFVASGGSTPASTESLITDVNGDASFTYFAATVQSAGIQGAELLAATATPSGSSVPITQTDDITVEPASFGFTSPAAGSQVAQNTRKTLTFQWTLNSKPVNGGSVTLTAGQGALIDQSNNLNTTLTEVTNSSGTISVDLLTNSASGSPGQPLTVTATGADSGSGAQMSAQLSLLVVGAPNSFSPIASTPISPGASSLITVVVFDSASNRLVGIPVNFALENGTGAGTLSPSSDTTDSTGTAQAIYRATGDSTGASVKIDVTVPPLTMQTVTIDIGS